MRFLFYTHSLVSDWNHGNAHFLRGVMRELIALGHHAVALEPVDGWSRTNLVARHGEQVLEHFAASFPELRSVSYGPDFDHEAQVEHADVVIVHEWTDPMLVAQLGKVRREGGRFTLLFHDTHHRAVSETPSILELPLQDYDVILAFGEALRERYLRAGWGRNVHTWHEAADVRLFTPRPDIPRQKDVVWIGNWGDGERSSEIADYFIGPATELGLSASVHGVRYPPAALSALSAAGIDYLGWLPNAEVPDVFACYQMTVHIPRRPYVESLPGIPTIRMFEALACGIPLISAPWDDTERLFRADEDFLFARSPRQMRELLRVVAHDKDVANALATNGVETIAARHTCAHRVNQLLDILSLHGSARVIDQLQQKEAAQ